MVEAGRYNERKVWIAREAARLFLENGYETTTVRQIASAVGLRSGSLFSHFESKQEILALAMDWGLRLALERADGAIEGANGVRERLLSLSRAHFKALLGEAADALALSLYEWRSLSPDSREEIVRLRDEYEARWHKVLEEAREEGIIRTRDLYTFRLFALGAANSAVQWYRTGGEYDIEALARRFVAFVLGEDQT